METVIHSSKGDSLLGGTLTLRFKALTEKEKSRLSEHFSGKGKKFTAVFLPASSNLTDGIVYIDIKPSAVNYLRNLLSWLRHSLIQPINRK